MHNLRMNLKLGLLLFLYSGFLHGQDIKCPQEGIDPLTKTQMKDAEKVLKVAELTIKEKQKAQHEKEITDARNYLASLPEEKRNKVNELITKIQNNESKLITLIESDGPPVLFLKGLDLELFPAEWIKPLAHIADKKTMSYFFRWSKFDSLEKNRDELITIIKSLLAKHKDQPLTIIGYSAGGVITTHAISELKNDPESERIKFHTIASPLYGYNAPVFALLGIPFVGKTTIDIGMGPAEKLKNKTLNNCRHWINLNCEKDSHACDYQGIKPFTGKTAEEKQMPCGNENTVSFSDEGHGSVLGRAVSVIIK